MARRLKSREFGQSIQLSSSTHKINCGADFIGVQAITIVSWIKINGNGGGNARVVDNGKTVLSVATAAGGTNKLRFRSDGSTDALSTSIIQRNRWTFVAATRDAAGLAQLYINGVADGASQSSGTPVAGSTNLFIGNDSAGPDNLNGNIESVRIFNRVLTAIEIANLYYDGQHPNVASDVNTNIIATYAFSEGGGTTAIDTGPYARNGTITGAFYSLDVPMHSRLKARSFGTSLDFSQAADKVDVGTEIIGTGDLTFCAWVKVRSVGATAGRIADNGKFNIAVGSTRRLSVSSDGSTSVLSNNEMIPFENKWRFIAITRTSAGLTNFFVNGLPFCTPDQSSGTPVAGTSNTIIGNNSGGTRNFDGKMDNIRTFNKILSQGEIEAIWREGRMPSVAPGVNTSITLEYLFDEGSGTTAIDTSPYGRNGTITGAVYSADVATGTRNKSPDRTKLRDHGTSIVFDGVTTNISAASVNEATTGFTTAFWVKLQTTLTRSSFIYRANGNSNYPRVFTNLNGTVTFQFAIAGQSSQSITSASPLQKGMWYQIIAVIDSPNNLASLYINGVSVASTTLNGGAGGLVATGTSTLLIGNDTNISIFLQGILDNLRIFSRALPADEVNTMYRIGAFSRANLTLEYLLNEGSGTTAIDSSGYNRNGTITGGTYTTDVPLALRRIV